VRVAAYQAPLLASGSNDSIERIREQVRLCETNGVSLLCCPEAILGGLADHADEPAALAIRACELESVLRPIASEAVTTIVGFTEITDGGHLYNSAALFHRGAVYGIYRKLYPAINKSVYGSGESIPTFQVGDLRLGIVICNDSNYFEPARLMAAQGATALFVPTNNALHPSKGGPELVALARKVGIARALENGVWVIRADVAGHSGGRTSFGSSSIVNPDGVVIQSGAPLTEDLLIADIGTKATANRLGWDVGRNPAVVSAYSKYSFPSAE
jgi:predicted amidohydrolase